MTVQLVTGFVPIKDHPRPLEVYKEQGERLLAIGKKLGNPIILWEGAVEDCWLYTALKWKGGTVKFATADNPKKNSVAYHCVQHQKTEWLYAAASLKSAPDVFVWIDYGIFTVPGVTEEGILTMIRRANHEKTVTIPGCWNTPGDCGDQTPNWRFCGGLIVCPRAHVFALDAFMKAEAIRHLHETNTVTWEVNTLARVELATKLPIWWYSADHNNTMFTNYPEGHHAS